MNKYFLLKTGKKTTTIPVLLFKEPKKLNIFSTPLAWKIYKEFANPACPVDVAKKLKIHEQKVYYYVKKFRKEGLLKEVSQEQRKGTVAKFYQTKHQAFAFKSDTAPEKEIHIPSPAKSANLEPFIENNKLNAKIIVGSPDPHGPWKARASDSCCAIDFALFIGSFTDGKNVPNYKLDTEIRESDLKHNLIVIGGPTVNMVTRKINNKLPIRIDIKTDYRIVSDLSGKSYTDDTHGMAVIIENPWKTGKKILVIAGKRFAGTRAGVLACITKLNSILKGNRFKPEFIAKVVKGYDMDGDGVIDTAEILE